MMFENKMTEADWQILKILMNQKLGLSGFHISRLSGVSYTHTMLRLRILMEEGFVKKSMGKRYYIPKIRKEELLETKFSEKQKGEVNESINNV